MTEDYLRVCRYNKNHRVRATKLVIHELNCPERKEEIKTCVFNPNHKYHISEAESHRLTCESRPIWLKELNSDEKGNCSKMPGEESLLGEKRKNTEMLDFQSLYKEVKEKSVKSEVSNESKLNKRQQYLLEVRTKKEIEEIKRQLVTDEVKDESRASSYKIDVSEVGNLDEKESEIDVKVEEKENEKNKEVVIISETDFNTNDNIPEYEGEAFLNEF